jgi:hypothetical protein
VILPNEDFLRAAEALRLHNFIALETVPGSPHYLDGLDMYAAQYEYPPEITERLGSNITIALFPASFVGWKLNYNSVPNPLQKGSFIMSLSIERLPPPVEIDVEQSFIQLSLSSSDINDAMSVASEESTSTINDGGKVEDSDDEYVMIQPRTLRQRPVERGSVAMQRGNGPKSPTESVCLTVHPIPKQVCEAVEMLPGRNSSERSGGDLIMIEKGIYTPRREALKESFKNAMEFLRRDKVGGSKFAKVLEGWSYLLGGHEATQSVSD